MTSLPKWDGKQPIMEYAMSLPPAPPRPGPIDPTPDDELTQSPLEHWMYQELIEAGMVPASRAEVPGIAVLHQQYPVEIEEPACNPTFLHIDLAAIRTVGHRTVKVAIELDGHEFHHATKTQVERDYRRGRVLARQGWIVVRFAGSEVHRSPRACALEIVGIVIEAVDRIESGR